MRRTRAIGCIVLATACQWAAHAQAVPPLPASQWTLDQVRQAFSRADADGDGQLSRAEAQRLPLMPRSFEDTDLNKDGVIVLADYEASFRP